MTLFKKMCAVLILPLVVACSSNNNNPFNDSGSGESGAQLRVTHASADAPAVNVYINGELALERVEFKQSSGLVPVEEPGTIDVEVRGLLPDESELSVIGPVQVTLEEGVRTDVVAFGDLLDGSGAISIAPKVLDPVDIENDIDDVRVSVMHAAPQVGAVDIYVTTPGDDLAAYAPIDASFGDAAGPVAIEADTQYQIRITSDGTADVVFDSGPLSFAAGTELLLVAVENTYKVGASPVTLVAAGADGASEVTDVNIGAEVRVVHNSADTPAVDVLIDGAEVLNAVTFTQASNYDDIPAPAGTYNVVVALDEMNEVAPINENLTLEATKSYTAIAVGSPADSALQLLVNEDERRNIATAAIVEVVHGSYLVAEEIPVDVYLTADGVIADAQPAVPSLAYGESTGQLPLAPGKYWVTVTVAGDKSQVVYDSGAALELNGNVNYTVIARDPSLEEVTGSPLINVTILTD